MWIDRNGKFFDGRLELDGKVIFIDLNSEPDPELMRRAGFTQCAPPEAEPEPENPDFLAVKAAFWAYVDEAAAALTTATGTNYSRADFPSGAYSADLLAWCAEHGMTEAATGALAVKFCGIAADLARLGRNWAELFEGDAAV